MGITFAGGRQEAELAHYAEFQGQTNSCGEYAVAAALSLLKGQARWLPAQKAVTIADSSNFRDRFRLLGLWALIPGGSFRMWPNGPTTSWQAANLAKELARREGMRVDAEVKYGSGGPHADLIDCLGKRNEAAIVTIAWDDRTQANIEHPGGSKIPLLSTPAWKLADVRFDYTAHIMLLVAHDEDKKRWGFINSWVDGTVVDRLFWMTEEDFDETWSYERGPFIPRLWVKISSRD